MEIVAEYAEAMLSGAEFPPLETYFDGVSYWLADGFHRYYAAIKAGLTEFESKVGTPGTAQDAKWASLAANHKHGLRRTNADKRKAVDIALRMNFQMSDRAIAQHCGVSDMLVANIRKSGASVPIVSQNTTQNVTQVPENENRCKNLHVTEKATHTNIRTGMDGKVYAIPAQKPQKSEPFIPPPPPPPMPKHETKDSIGRVVPKNLLQLWGRGSEIAEMIDTLSKLRCKIRKAQDEKDPLFATCNFSAVLAEIDSSYTQLKSIQPYAVCPSCQGNGACRVCGDSGIISKFRWDTVVSKELKDLVIAEIK